MWLRMCVFFRREELSSLGIFCHRNSGATPSSSPGEGWEGVRCRLFASLQKLGHTCVCYHLHGYCGVSTARHPCSVAQTMRNSTHYPPFTVMLTQAWVSQCFYMSKEREAHRKTDRQRDTDRKTHAHRQKESNRDREKVLGKYDRLWVLKLNEVCV